MSISASDVKNLREKTGLGMMECKKALEEAKGDAELAITNLRKNSALKAEKKSSRTAVEGVILSSTENSKNSILVEINCETDFVAKDENFLKFVKTISEVSLKNYKGSVDDFNNSKHPSGKTIEEIRLELVSKVGENVKIRRVQNIKNDGNYMGHYMHGTKIGVAVVLQKENEELAKDVCMHIAAMKPKAIKASDVDIELIEVEKRVATEKAAESGKPPEIVKKMVDGAVNKFLKEVSLYGQVFVKSEDNKTTIEQLLSKYDATVNFFSIFVVGEGLEKKTENFADEVAATTAAAKIH